MRVAARSAGTLEQLLVARGDEVAAGALLFKLDATAEVAARDEATAELAAAEARLADLRKGKRAPEIDLIGAQKAQAAGHARAVRGQSAPPGAARRHRGRLEGAARCGARDLSARPGAGRGARRRARGRAPGRARGRAGGGRGRGRGGAGRAGHGEVAAGRAPGHGAGRRRRSPTPSTGRASMSAPARRWSSCCRPPTSSCASSCPSRCWAV